MPKARVGEIEMYYELAGTGPRLLFIGGTGGDLRTRPGVFEGPLAKSFELLAYDQRGLGRTDRPRRAYTMAEYADDAAGLLDHIGWESCLVFGVSFGGMVAQELVLRHPERVARLALACTSSGGGGGASYPLHELQALKIEERFARMIELSDVRNDAAWRSANPDAFGAAIEFQRKRRNVGDPDNPNAQEGAQRQLEARQHHDTFDRLHRVEAPTYLCGGRYDGISPPANLEALHARIENSTLEFFEGGHLFMIQDRAAYPRIIEFLTSV